MNIKTQRLCTWSGVFMIFMFIVAFGPIARLIKPPAPNDSALKVAERYADHQEMIQLGLVITTMVCVLAIPFSIAIGLQMKRVEGGEAPLAQVQKYCGVVLVVAFITPMLVFQTAVYRPMDDPNLTMRLSDMAWLMFVAVVCSVILQSVVIGWVAIQDKRPDPVFPRWVGYFNFWVALCYVGSGLTPFFKDGPLAYNGVIAWYLGLSAYTIWVLVMSGVLLNRSIPHQVREELDAQARTQEPYVSTAG